jgi:hypothetical protein
VKLRDLPDDARAAAEERMRSAQENFRRWPAESWAARDLSDEEALELAEALATGEPLAWGDALAHLYWAASDPGRSLHPRLALTLRAALAMVDLTGVPLERAICAPAKGRPKGKKSPGRIARIRALGRDIEWLTEECGLALTEARDLVADAYGVSRRTVERAPHPIRVNLEPLFRAVTTKRRGSLRLRQHLKAHGYRMPGGDK